MLVMLTLPSRRFMMPNKICLIRQTCGLGDIFFTQKIAAMWVAGGYEIVWPVEDMFLKEVKAIQSDFEFCSVSDDFPHKELFSNDKQMPINESDFCYLPLQHSYELLSGGAAYTGTPGLLFPTDIHPLMQAKYHLVGVDYSDWASYFEFDRNQEKEKELYYDILGLDDQSFYSVINDTFARDLHIDIPQLPGKVVSMGPFPQFILFDWYKVMQTAISINTVDTALSFLIEKMALSVLLNVYSRGRYQCFSDLELNTKMFSQPWKCVQ